MYLIVTREGNPLHIMPMAEGVLAVGRDVRNGLTLDDQAVSPRQVEIQVKGGLATVNSVGGTPGFVYQGKPHFQVVLPEGHEVHVGPYQLRVEADRPTIPAASGSAGAPRGAPGGADWDEDIFGEALGQLFEEDDGATEGLSSGAAIGWAPDEGEEEGPDAPDPEETTFPWSAADIDLAKTLPMALSPGEGAPEGAEPVAAAVDEAPGDASLAETQPIAGRWAPSPSRGLPISLQETQRLPPITPPIPPPAAPTPEPAPEPTPPAQQAPEASPAVAAPAPWEADEGALVGPHLTQEGPRASAPLKLRQGTSFLGSAEGMDLILADPTVARRHAAVIYKDGRVRLRDMTGHQTTRVNGEETQARLLRHGDTLRLGLTELRFVWHGQPPSALIPEATEDDTDEDAGSLPTSGRRRGVALAVGLAAVAALLGVGASVLPGLGGDPAPELARPDTPDPAQVRVARALIEGGRYESGLDLTRAMPEGDGTALALRHRAEEARAAEALAFGLWYEKVGEAHSRGDWAGIRREEGAALLARAEGAFGRGDPPELVDFWVVQARLAYEDAQRLRPRSDETEAGLEAARRLTGRLEVQGDTRDQRLREVSPGLLLERGKEAAEAGQLNKATRTLEAVVSRGAKEGLAPALIAEATGLLAEVQVRQAETLSPLYDAAEASLQGGRPEDARAIYQGILRLEPGDPRALEALKALALPLREAGAKALSEAEVALAADSPEVARSKLRQVLRYVPDRSEPLHREALKKLEALAGAS